MTENSGNKVATQLIPMNLVINGHGGKTDNFFDVGNNVLMTPGDLNEPYITSVDSNYNLEKDFLNGQIKPIEGGEWNVYAKNSNKGNLVPDVKISPWNSNELTFFSQNLLTKPNLWSDVDNKQGLYIDRDPNCILVIRSKNNEYKYLKGQQIKDYLQANQKDGTAVFFLAPQVGKIKILNNTSLSEIIGCLKDLNIENKNIICATCNNKLSNDKNIKIDHTGKNLSVSEIIAGATKKNEATLEQQKPPSIQNSPLFIDEDNNRIIGISIEPDGKYKINALNASNQERFITYDPKTKKIEGYNGTPSSYLERYMANNIQPIFNHFQEAFPPSPQVQQPVQQPVQQKFPPQVKPQVQQPVQQPVQAQKFSTVTPTSKPPSLFIGDNRIVGISIEPDGKYKINALNASNQERFITYDPKTKN